MIYWVERTKGDEAVEPVTARKGNLTKILLIAALAGAAGGADGIVPAVF